MLLGRGSANVGGAVGKMTGSLSHCYVVGDVLGDSRTGVLAGYLDAGGTYRVFGSFAIPLTSGDLLGQGTTNSLLYVKLLRRSASDFCFGSDSSMLLLLPWRREFISWRRIRVF